MTKRTPQGLWTQRMIRDDGRNLDGTLPKGWAERVATSSNGSDNT